jgi:hypothetical protein
MAGSVAVNLDPHKRTRSALFRLLLHASWTDVSRFFIYRTEIVCFKRTVRGLGNFNGYGM